MQSGDGWAAPKMGVAGVVAVLAKDRFLGAQVPRIRVVPEGVDHPKLAEVERAVERLWPEFDQWQWDGLRAGLLRTRDMSMWAAFTVAFCAPRQNGKNVILEAREVIGPTILGETLVIHTAHLADTSKEGFRRLDQLIDADDWLAGMVKHIWRTNGHETIEFKSGGRIRFRTRTRGGGRGFSGSPVMFDEPMFLPEISMKSILPVISAQPDPQVWYTGSAVDQVEHEDGVVFARVRDRAVRGDHDRLVYFEWSLDFDTPDDVEDEVAADPASWAATNPALGVRISPEYVQAEIRELDARGFAVERLGVGDWPAVDGSGALISIEDWDALADMESRAVDPVWFIVDVSPDRSMTSIAAVGRRLDGLFHVEVVDARGGTGWVVARCVELRDRHKPAGFACDAVGPASSLVQPLAEAGIEVRELSTTEHTRACGLMYDAVHEARLRHGGTPELRAAIRGAATRALGDAWAWSRKNSSVDITSLVAVTLGVGIVAEATSVPEPWVMFS